jgi:hypothetical protein
MVRTVENEPLQKHTLSFYKGDFEKMAEFHAELGASVAIRRVIRAHIRKLESGLQPLPELKVETTL